MGRPKLNRRKEEKPMYMPDISDTIKWSGMVHLDITNEDDESLLGVSEWPKKSGIEVYACATSGLLFSKQTGDCIQSSKVHLRLDTIQPHASMRRREVVQWSNSRQAERDKGVIDSPYFVTEE